MSGADWSKTDDRSGAPTGAADVPPFMRQIAGPWEAMAGVWKAWLDAAESLSRERGAAAGKSLTRMFEPAFWKSGELGPLLEELRHALSLPQLADLPSPDLSILDSSAAMLDVVGLANQYMAVSIPMWVSASQRFQHEIAERSQRGEPVKSPGEALDLWNGVVDRTLMEFNRSGEFARIQQRLLRASAQYRLELRKIGERSARVFDMPTRAEMTDIYRRMHDMQREIQTLRREVRTLRQAASPQDAGGAKAAVETKPTRRSGNAE
jgi:hypothetical protein